MRLEQVEWYRVPDCWPQVAEWVAKALEHGGVIYCPADILRALLTRDMQLWLAWDGEALRACCVTRLASYPKLRVCCVLIIGGDGVDDWLMFSKDIEAWAQESGAQAIEGVGRLGWRKKAAPFGYQPEGVIYRKRL